MIIVDQLDSIVISVANLINTPEDQIRLLICMFLQIPIGIFMNMFVSKSTLARHLYSIILGLFL